MAVNFRDDLIDGHELEQRSPKTAFDLIRKPRG
jgi:hypothetical protein